MAQYFFEFQIFGNSDDQESTPPIPATCTAASVTEAAEKIMAYLQSVGMGNFTVEKLEDVIDITFLDSGLCVRLLGVTEITPEELYARLDITRTEQVGDVLGPFETGTD